MLDRATAASDLKSSGTPPGQPRWHSIRLETVPQDHCDALSAAFRAARALTLQLGDRAMLLSAHWLPQEPDIAEPWTVAIQINNRQAELVLPEALLLAAVTDLDEALSAASLEGDLGPILVEYALREGLQALEAALNCRLSVGAVSRGRHPVSGGMLAMPLRIDAEALGEMWGLLRLPPAQLQGLAAYLGGTANRIAAGPVNLPLPVHLRWASVELTLGQLRSLEPGDIILVDESCRQPGMAVAVIGEHLVAPVELLRSGYRVGGNPRRAPGSGFEWSIARDGAAAHAAPEIAVEDIPVRLFFEFGRLELDRAAAGQLRSGMVLGLARPLEEGLDIVARGVRIGRGEVTAIGDAAGIRVTRL